MPFPWPFPFAKENYSKQPVLKSSASGFGSRIFLRDSLTLRGYIFPHFYRTNDRTSTKILKQLHLRTRNSPLYLVSHLDPDLDFGSPDIGSPDSGYGRDPPWRWSTLSACSRYCMLLNQFYLTSLYTGKIR